jgi:alpha-beta hydrolase superfamily lysophospholipase
MMPAIRSDSSGRANQRCSSRIGRRCALLALAVIAPAASAPLQAGKQTPEIRGRRQDVYVFPASSSPPKASVLFAPGDGGWRGFAIPIAETLSSWGYDVFGLDTKRYLESFTGGTTLQQSDVMTDMRAIAEWIARRSPGPLLLLGWSEGAGLAVLAAASPENKSSFGGIVVVGLPESAVLGWRWQDAITYVTKKPADEPRYSTAVRLPAITPLPFAMIHSSHDEYTPVSGARKLFEAAREPKRFTLVEAHNHRFEGNRDDFFRALRESLDWIHQAHR